jgi:hypothetical protein
LRATIRRMATDHIKSSNRFRKLSALGLCYNNGRGNCRESYWVRQALTLNISSQKPYLYIAGFASCDVYFNH